MVNTIDSDAHVGYEWIDLMNPDKGELEKIAARYGIPQQMVDDCLDARHLPKFEREGDLLFMVLRVYDERIQNENCNTIQELTRKLAIFVRGNTLITVHRGRMNYFDVFVDNYRKAGSRASHNPEKLMLQLVNASCATYHLPLDRAEQRMDAYEFDVFNNPRKEFEFEQFYLFRRQLAIIRKMLRMTLDFTGRLDLMAEHGHSLLLQDVKDNIESSLYQADEMLTDSNNLTNSYFNLSSHRNNEVIRVLTIFSVFFLPLTFIAGIYGMNFDVMPELRWFYGYPFSLALMLGICVGIYFWFKKNKWM